MELLQHPAFPIYALCAALLVFKMMVVGHVTGVTRIRRGVFLNPEDVETFGSGGDTAAAEHPDVERGLRAHRNDLESTLPFLAIGIVYLLIDPSAGLARGLFIAFTALRYLFSVFYFARLQPWRSLSFMAAEVCLLVMLAQMAHWGVTH